MTRYSILKYNDRYQWLMMDNFNSRDSNKTGLSKGWRTLAGGHESLGAALRHNQKQSDQGLEYFTFGTLYQCQEHLAGFCGADVEQVDQLYSVFQLVIDAGQADLQSQP